jgi:hypothetical protein
MAMFIERIFPVAGLLAFPDVDNTDAIPVQLDVEATVHGGEDDRVVDDHLGFPGELILTFDEGYPLTPLVHLYIVLALLPQIQRCLHRLPAIIELILRDQRSLHGGWHAQREDVSVGELHDERLELLSGTVT